jgi:hypothetical protein
MLLLIPLLLLLLLGIAGAADERVIQIEYAYTPPEVPKLEGFVLYQNNIEICTTTVINTNTFDCAFNSLPGTHNYTMAATFVDGTEGPKSPPYTFTIEEATDPTSPLIPIIIKLNITDIK